MQTTSTDWEARYEEGRTRWERPGANPAFDAWRADGTLVPGRILVPGAGRSIEPLLLAQGGFAVTVVDLAPTAIATQTPRLAPLGGTVLHADLLHFAPAEPFDAIYDQTCLCALPPAILPEYAARLHAWLCPGGVLAVLFMQTGQEGGPPFHCDMDAMRALFPAALWQWPAELPARVPHPSGIVEEQPAALRRL